MSIVKFASTEIEVMIHSTEDINKVLSAIKNILSIEPEEFAANTMLGHFRNEIVRFRAKLSSKRASQIAYKIIAMMTDDDRLSIYNNFNLYTDEKNSVYLRISKQKIFEHKIILDQVDSLKIKLKPVRRFQSRKEIENYRNMLMIGDGD
ncbi:MAG: RNA-binding domain-containing protein [Nitrososphaerales archaeon]